MRFDRPDRDQWIDLGFAAVAMVLSVTGFRATFAGGEELIVGIPAVAVGVVVAAGVMLLRIGLLPSVAVALTVWVAAGGLLAIRSEALWGVLPTLGVLEGLATGLVAGWIRLLTTVPPAGEAGNLLTIPYFVGYFGAMITVFLAWRLKGLWCVAMPIAVLVVALLFGTHVPAAILLQGGALAAVTVAWAAVRSARRSILRAGVVSRRRQASAATLVVAIAVVAPLVAPHLPGADANPRFVLREHVVPPFDPLQHPSPLGGYRRYVGADNERAEIMTVSGLPAGVPIRLAVMDSYDGLVWRASGRGDALAGRFVRIGERIPTDRQGETVEIEVVMHRPHGVWLPTVGDVARIDIHDRAQMEALRFNLATDTAAVPGGVRTETTYALTVVLPEDLPADEELRQMPLDPRYREPSINLPNDFVEVAARLRGGSEAPYARMESIAAALRTDGAFSNGGPEAIVATPPGHSLARLARFLGAPQWVGNGEQYAAALGLLAAAEGIPARVVMGFMPSGRNETFTVTGADISAWVEVPLAGIGWVPVIATPPEDNEPDPTIRPRARELSPEAQPPPPPPPPRSQPNIDDLESIDEDEEEAEEIEEPAGTPWLAIAAGVGAPTVTITPFGLIVGAKLLRRRRRRSAADPRVRAHGGWSELIDQSRDLGRLVPAAATRQELATVVAVEGAPELARHVDEVTFSSSMATLPAADEVWRRLPDVVGRLRSEHSWWQRQRALFSVTSLRTGRRA